MGQDDLFKSMSISASGMKAQGTRLRVISENLANVNSLPTKLGEEPYQRKVTVFKNRLNRELGATTVSVDRVRPDKSDFGKKFDPSHPAANEDGYVQTPNVNGLIEAMDMKEAQRSYEANVNVIKMTKEMIGNTLSILR
ncbi:MAG: flagellar basal body rod protein FlgC [Alphaproteobacteria bacterium]|nr:flagellar basal body rod protein FlgC [Rhodospirillales bacterium]MCW9046264.1 flagellar basal body rod protein FlgC [Alphaproteobacteria bacterium]